MFSILDFMFLKYIFFFAFILDAIFLWYNFFSFLGQCVASRVILMCSLLFHSSVVLGQRSLKKRTCAVVIFFGKKLSSHIGSFH